MPYTVIILAGGLATRLRPITSKIPKTLIQVANKPFIAHQLDLLKNKGIDKVLILAGYLGEQIQEYVKDGSDYGLQIDYSFDGEKLLGTGGAINKALPFLEDVFGVIYGDSYLDIEYKSIFNYFLTNNKKGLMTVINNENKWDKSNVIFKDNEIVNYDKNNISSDMQYIDYGFGIFKKSAFSDWEQNLKFGLDEVYINLIKRNQLLGYEVFQRFYEIGSFYGIKETEKYLIRRK